MVLVRRRAKSAADAMVQPQDASSDYAMTGAEVQVNNRRTDSRNRPQNIAFLYRREQPRRLSRGSGRVQQPKPFY
jgi:hypothetical protein